jgi:hypothetical protein
MRGVGCCVEHHLCPTSLQCDNRTAKALCPCNNDHRPSLSVYPRRDGKGTRVKCHADADCDMYAIFDALGLLGAAVGAADLTAGIEPYRRPAPFDRREYPVKGHVGNRVEIFDLEDADYQQQLERGYATASQLTRTMNPRRRAADL